MNIAATPRRFFLGPGSLGVLSPRLRADRDVVCAATRGEDFNFRDDRKAALALIPLASELLKKEIAAVRADDEEILAALAHSIPA